MTEIQILLFTTTTIVIGALGLLRATERGKLHIWSIQNIPTSILPKIVQCIAHDPGRRRCCIKRHGRLSHPFCNVPLHNMVQSAASHGDCVVILALLVILQGPPGCLLHKLVPKAALRWTAAAQLARLEQDPRRAFAGPWLRREAGSVPRRD